MKAIDLTGQEFGRLTVIERAKNKGNKVMWLCQCECGNIIVAQGYNLTSGHTQSCGCYAKENHYKTHCMSGTRLHNEWRSMKRRCYTKGQKEFKNYGARGIAICDEWLHDFKAFYDWAMSSGYADNLTIDRIDVNGNYEPSNCRWVTQKVQQNNRRNNHYITYNGETLTAMQYSEKYNLNYSTLITRLSRGWSVEKIMNK